MNPNFSDQAFAVGLDIGGTKTEAIVVDQDHQLQSRVSKPTDTTNPEQVLAGIIETVHEALCRANATPQQLRVIGGGVPGLVDPETGMVRQAVNLNLNAYPLGPALTTEFNTPAFLENDVRAAAVGAFEYFNRQEPVTHIAYLSIGTGISAGLILDGSLYRGANGMAGEIGHAVVDPNGVQCRCGTRGCLETIAAGPAIVRQALAADPTIGTPTPLDEITAGHVYAAAQSGNKAAQQVIQYVSGTISRTIQWLIMSYDVDKLLLGGGVSRAGEAFLQPILKELSHLRMQSTLAKEMLLDDKVALIPQAYNAGVWGAILLAEQMMNNR
ncbi:MAG: ROK family protein [Anaerolineales bacterium]|nr:ROK family protein [Anaerolineales bacterium]MCA9926884.1 ROK family protein [Anaerolineales bacterium]